MNDFELMSMGHPTFFVAVGNRKQELEFKLNRLKNDRHNGLIPVTEVPGAKINYINNAILKQNLHKLYFRVHQGQVVENFILYIPTYIQDGAAKEALKRNTHNIIKDVGPFAVQTGYQLMKAIARGYER
jgi:hypothetical protein